MTVKKTAKKKSAVKKSTKPAGSKASTKKSAPKKSATAPGTPKVGDKASLAFHYAGLVSFEDCEIDKVAQGAEVLWVSEQLYERKSDGTYVYEDYTLGACKKIIYLDGGKRVRDYDKENA